MRRLIRLSFVLVVGGALTCAAGCATLTTWERSTLMSRVMLDPANGPESAIEEHVHAVREAAQGATTAAGSSCGCN